MHQIYKNILEDHEHLSLLSCFCACNELMLLSEPSGSFFDQYTKLEHSASMKTISHEHAVIVGNYFVNGCLKGVSKGSQNINITGFLVSLLVAEVHSLVAWTLNMIKRFVQRSFTQNNHRIVVGVCFEPVSNLLQVSPTHLKIDRAVSLLHRSSPLTNPLLKSSKVNDQV